MTGTDSYSTTPATNATADGGSINWAEGQPPSSVNNSARQWMADERASFNDLIWFQYGSGDQGAGNLAVPCVYFSATAFTIAGVNVTTAWHTGRRVRAVGSSTGTIYGSISSSAFSTNTTVNVTWDSGSLSNETLVVSLSQIPVTGNPIPVSFGGSTTVAQLSDGTIILDRIQKTTGIAQSTTVDVFRFLTQAGTQTGTNFISGTLDYNIIDEASGANNTSGQVWIAADGSAGATALVPYMNVSSNPTQFVRGTTLVTTSPLSSVADGLGTKIQLTTSASGKTVTCRISFRGLVQ